jgi:hypothetical protein
MMVQVPKSEYHRCLTVTKNTGGISKASFHTQDRLLSRKVLCSFWGCHFQCTWNVTNFPHCFAVSSLAHLTFIYSLLVIFWVVPQRVVFNNRRFGKLCLFQLYRRVDMKSRIHLFIHSSFHWHVQNMMIPCCSQELLPFLCVIYFSLPPFFILPTSLTSSCHHFLVHLSILLFPNSYIRLFWELCFLPFSVHAQTNVSNVCNLIVSVIVFFFSNCTNFFIR